MKILRSVQWTLRFLRQRTNGSLLRMSHIEIRRRSNYVNSTLTTLTLILLNRFDLAKQLELKYKTNINISCGRITVINTSAVNPSLCKRLLIFFSSFFSMFLWRERATTYVVMVIIYYDCNIISTRTMYYDPIRCISRELLSSRFSPLTTEI